jgi:hypothetical protein
LFAVDLYKTFGADLILWRAARTSSDGIAVLGEKDGGIAEGDYAVHLGFVTKFVLGGKSQT